MPRAQSSSGTDTGRRLGDFNALAAVVLGGISSSRWSRYDHRTRGHGCGNYLHTHYSGMVRLRISGNPTTAIIGIILLLAVGFNVKWVKNKGKVLAKGL